MVNPGFRNETEAQRVELTMQLISIRSTEDTNRKEFNSVSPSQKPFAILSLITEITPPELCFSFRFKV